MSIRRYTASADTTITNAFEANLQLRGTGSNMGASDILEAFSIYGQQDSASSELSRILIKFPIDQIQTDRSASTIPASGNVDFYLRLFNAKHSQTLPKDYKKVRYGEILVDREQIKGIADEYAKQLESNTLEILERLDGLVVGITNYFVGAQSERGAAMSNAIESNRALSQSLAGAQTGNQKKKEGNE